LDYDLIGTPGFKPTGVGLWGVVVLAGLLVLLPSLKHAGSVLSVCKRKEAPMKPQPRVLGFVVSVLNTIWAIGTGYMATTLPA